jgi:Uma2 family endonuclease
MAEVPGMPVLHTSRVAIVESELADLERVYASLDVPDHRIELLDGQVTVSPTASRLHSRIVQRLQEALWGRIHEHGWELHTNLTLHVAATRERLVPDLWVCPGDAPQFDENEVYGQGALLVAEVVSAASRHRDLVDKARAYAQAGVPLYLVIDPTAVPAVLTLHSVPRGDAYRSRVQADAGKALALPDPFGIELDVKNLLPSRHTNIP